MKKGNSKIKNKYFLVASICFYISSVIMFFSRSNIALASTNFCLASCCLALSLKDANNDKK